MLLQSLKLDLELRGYKPHTISEYVRTVSELVTDGNLSIPPTKLAVAAWLTAAPSMSVRRRRWLAGNALFRMLVEEELLEHNPFQKIPIPKEAAKPQPILSDADFDKLLATCDKSWLGIRDKALLCVLASTGCRRAELVDMRKTDLSLEAGQIVIRNGKGGKWRVSYLDVPAKKSLLRYLRSYKPNTQDHLWTTERGEALSSNALRLMLKRRSEQAGVKVSAHQFRRRMATNWLLAGGSQVGLMNAAGWSSVAMPARYTAMRAQEIAQAEFHRMQGWQK